MLGTQRLAPLLASDGAESYPAGPMMRLLCLFSFVAGCSFELFPYIASPYLDRDANFDTGKMGTFASIRTIFVLFGSLLWGSMASRGSLTRKQILVIAALFSGLITTVTWMFLSNFIVLLCLRAMDGFFLSAVGPVTYSIVGDRFNDASRGKCFALLLMSSQAGAAFTRALTNYIAPEGGWYLMFLVIGGLTVIVAALMQSILVVPQVKVSASGSNLQSVCQVLKRSSFQILVLQGFFGVIPWAAMNYRGLFFEYAGFNEGQVAVILGDFATFAAILSAFLGGLVGDCLSSSRPLHGRVLTAQITVFVGIPIVFVTFMMSPIGDPFNFYLIMTIILVLMTGWIPAAVNNPILCTLAREDERSLIFAFTGVLATVVEVLSFEIGSFMLAYVVGFLGYDGNCGPGEPGCNNAATIGQTIFVMCCIGWGGAGLLYSLLHCTYPKDVEAIQAEREGANAGSELAAPQA